MHVVSLLLCGALSYYAKWLTSHTRAPVATRAWTAVTGSHHRASSKKRRWWRRLMSWRWSKQSRRVLRANKKHRWHWAGDRVADRSNAGVRWSNKGPYRRLSIDTQNRYEWSYWKRHLFGGVLQRRGPIYEGAQTRLISHWGSSRSVFATGNWLNPGHIFAFEEAIPPCGKTLSS